MDANAAIDSIPADNPITNLENWIIGLTFAVECLDVNNTGKEDPETKSNSSSRNEPNGNGDFSNINNYSSKLNESIAHISQLLQKFSDAVIQKVVEIEREEEEAEVTNNSINDEFCCSKNNNNSNNFIDVDVPDR